MYVRETPEFVVWDVTYACPLRCTHCYSESGRRPSRQLNARDMLQVTDAITSMNPKAVVLSGGEPLIVKGIFNVAERMRKAGIEVTLYTGGWGFDPIMLEPIMKWFSRVNVSLDGATAETHDHIRGRAGSFDRAISALAHLNDAARARKQRGERVPWMGIAFVVMQSNFHQMEEMCRCVLPQFPELRFISFGAVIPSGLATRVGFVEQEMLGEEQARMLAGTELQQHLQRCSPAFVEVRTTDNRRLQLHPDLIAAGIGLPGMQIEPDGMVRAMSSYEGTVGSLMEEDPSVLWHRAAARWKDPFVIKVLKPAKTMMAWAEAARCIDEQFGSPEVHVRIARRPPYNRD